MTDRYTDIMNGGISEKYLAIEYNLQFFAKDGPGGEKTEPATSKKLNDTRKQGQVAKSKDLIMAASLMSLFIIIKVYVVTMGEKLMRAFKEFYTTFEVQINDSGSGYPMTLAVSSIRKAFTDLIVITFPIFIVAVVIAVVGNMLQQSWMVTTEPMKPKFSKLSPINGFKRMFSMRTLVETAKSIALIIIIMALVYTTIKDKLMMIKGLYNISLNQAIEAIGDMVITLGLKISMFYLVIGITDFVYQKRKHHKEMMMTKQEIKDEY